MKIPGKFRIGAVEYTVCLATNLRSRHEAEGVCSSDEPTIYIDDGLTEEETAEAFVHEVLHCIEHRMSMELPHHLLQQLACCLTQVLLYGYGEPEPRDY